MDDPIWVFTVFTKNRDRWLTQDIARSFFHCVVDRAAMPNGTRALGVTPHVTHSREDIRHREDGASREHAGHGAPDRMRQDRESVARKEHRRFGERPLQMDIAHPGATRA